MSRSVGRPGVIAFGALIVVLWVLLWGELSLANLLSGLAVAAALLLLFRLDPPMGPRSRVRPLAASRFGAYFLWRLVVANIEVSRLVLRRRRPRDPGIVDVPLRVSDPRIVALVANATSLTPGTLSIDTVEAPPTLRVHVIERVDLDAVRAQVARFEELAVAAFGSDEARAALGGQRTGPGGTS